jgi:hypothetical protein
VVKHSKVNRRTSASADDATNKIVDGTAVNRVKRTFGCPTESLVERPLLFRVVGHLP